nr:DUF2306 domain-containing protein [uncultured Allomuricauda sp.]
MITKTNEIKIARPGNPWQSKVLNASAQLWFIIAVLGMWIFAFYVASFYGGAAIDNDFMKWNRVLPHGYIEGESMGNLAVAIHLLFAVIVMVGGPIQFIPQLRKHAPSLHRWNGRFYISAAFIISLSGVYMVISKGTISGLIGDISVSINGILIMIFAYLAIRNAIKRKIDVHRRWALRLFLAMAGVWFFRIGLMFWLFVNKGPVGFDPETFRGPFLVFLGFGQYLIPLVILELYFLVQKKKTKTTQILMSAGLLMLTAITAVGIFAATMSMWLPRIG